MKLLVAAAVLVALAAIGVTHAQTPEIDALQAAAEQGDSDAMFDLGVMYHRGFGVRQDLVQAHMWVNLSAATELNHDIVDLNVSPLYDSRIQYRESIAQEMNAEQIRVAQRLAREWDAAHPREPSPHTNHSDNKLTVFRPD